MTAPFGRIGRFLMAGLVYAARTAAMREAMPWHDQPQAVAPAASTAHNEGLSEEETGDARVAR